MPFDLLTVLPTRLDIEVNGFNGGVLNGVPYWHITGIQNGMA
ncbi:hypothetical protein [Escherichia coli]